MRFKIDENLPHEVAEMLGDYGWDCDSVPAENLSGADDERIMAACDGEGRILITFDTGFADIRAYVPAEHAGFVVLRLSSQDKPHALVIIKRVIERLRERPLSNELWIVDEKRIRIRG